MEDGTLSLLRGLRILFLFADNPPRPSFPNTQLQQIGQGAFGAVALFCLASSTLSDIAPFPLNKGEIYIAEDRETHDRVAVKIERQLGKKHVMALEVAVLKRLQGCPYVCHFVAQGRLRGFSYFVMELVGQSLSELRRLVGGVFSAHTAALIGFQAVSAIEALHNVGYVHRDIKPSNFAISLKREPTTGRHSIVLLDFGLARKYVAVDRSVRPARLGTGFRGTARYASINSHLGSVRKEEGDMEKQNIKLGFPLGPRTAGRSLVLLLYDGRVPHWASAVAQGEVVGTLHQQSLHSIVT